MSSPPTTASPPDLSNTPAVLGAAAVTVTAWASAFVVIRGTGEHFDPGSMALLRMLFGTVALGIIVAVRGFRAPPRRALWLVTAWGVAWFCLYNLALNAAELLIDAGTTAMLVNMAPLMVVALAGVLLGEGFPRPLLVGAPLAFLGVVLIGSASSTGRTGLVGVLLAVAAAALYAGATLVQKHLLRSVDAATLTFLGAAAGTVALLPWLGELAGDIGTAPVSSVLWVVYLGIVPTALGFTTWAYVLSRTSAGKTSATTYIVPAVAIGLAWLVLGETPGPLALLGGALCLLGVFVTRLRR